MSAPSLDMSADTCVQGTAGKSRWQFALLQKTIKPTRKTETDANPAGLASAHTKARTRVDSVESAEFRIATQSLADVLQERAKTGHSWRFIGIVLVFVLPQEGFLILVCRTPNYMGACRRHSKQCLHAIATPQVVMRV